MQHLFRLTSSVEYKREAMRLFFTVDVFIEWRKINFPGAKLNSIKTLLLFSSIIFPRFTSLTIFHVYSFMWWEFIISTHD